MVGEITFSMSAIVESDEEPSSSVLNQIKPGNHSARTKKRWSESSKASNSTVTNLIDADGVHAKLTPNHVFPAQLYSTESGRLFHAGKVLIVLVGLPARGKTHLTVSLTRYLRWLGVKTHAFHVGDYRRKIYTNFDDDIPQDYFNAQPKTSNGLFIRQQILSKCLEDIGNFFEMERGQVAIYDALNVLEKDRQEVYKKFSDKDIKVIFIESIVDDQTLIKKNVSNAVSSPDYQGWDPKEAVQDYLKRIEANLPIYEPIGASEKHLSYIKFINFGERLVMNNSQQGYLINRVVFFLMNSRIKSGCVYFARCGSSDLDKYYNDEELNQKGLEFSRKLADTLLSVIAERKSKLIKLERADSNLKKHQIRQPSTADGSSDDSFVVWTATRKRTSETANPFRERGITVRERYQLNQLNPGEVADMSREEIEAKFPDEVEQHLRDPYHSRYPRAESYHDLAVRMEPLLLELERMSGDILIIAHESVLRVLYGYFMACSCFEIPFIEFPRSDLVEISYTPYENIARRIHIDGVE